MAYFDQLFDSTLPMPVPVLAAAWVVVQGASAATGHYAQGLANRLRVVTTDLPPQFRLSLRTLLLQFGFGAYFFGCALLFGGGMTPFLGGGWFLVSCLGLAANLRQAWVLRHWAKGGVEGHLHIARLPALHETAANQWFATALFFSVLVLVPHLAIAGAALLTGLGALGVSIRVKVAAERAAAGVGSAESPAG